MGESDQGSREEGMKPAWEGPGRWGMSSGGFWVQRFQGHVSAHTCTAGSSSSEANKACSVRGHVGAGEVGEGKELQINIFYDHPSTNYVPPWQPLVAGLGLHCGRGSRLEGRLQ